MYYFIRHEEVMVQTSKSGETFLAQKLHFVSQASDKLEWFVSMTHNFQTLRKRKTCVYGELVI